MLLKINWILGKEGGYQVSNKRNSTIFLTNLSNFPKVNGAYEKFFSKPFPARSCVEVSARPKGALIEIEVIATQNV